MRRGTTPLHKFYIDADLSDVEVLYITYSQNGDVVLEKSLEDGDVVLDAEKKMITTRLTQAETLLFESDDDYYTNSGFAKSLGSKNVKVQVRWRTRLDRAYATDIVVTSVNEILKDGEI